MRGRPNSANGTTSTPVSRRFSACQTGRTPSRARISAASSPWVRMALVPQTLMLTLSGITPRLFQIPLQDLLCQLSTDPPSGLRWQAARIDRVEIAAGGKDMSHAARRRTAGASRNVTPIEPAQKIFDLVAGPAQIGHQIVAGKSQDSSHTRCNASDPATVINPSAVCGPSPCPSASERISRRLVGVQRRQPNTPSQHPQPTPVKTPSAATRHTTPDTTAQSPQQHQHA